MKKHSLFFILLLLVVSCNNEAQIETIHKIDSLSTVELDSVIPYDSINKADTIAIIPQITDSINNKAPKKQKKASWEDRYLEASFAELRAYRSNTKLFSNKRKTLTKEECSKIINQCQQLALLSDIESNIVDSLRENEDDTLLIDSLVIVNSAYSQLIIKLIDNENAWDFDFNKVKDFELKIMDSKDKKLRTYSWFTGIYIWGVAEHITTVKFIGDNGKLATANLDTNCYYHKINLIKTNGETYYMFFGYSRCEKNKYASIEVYKIIGDSLIKVPCFTFERDMELEVRRGFSFDLSYNDKTKILQHNKLEYNGLWYLPLKEKVKYKFTGNKFIRLEKFKNLSDNEVLKIESMHEKVRIQNSLCESIEYSIEDKDSDNLDSLYNAIDSLAIYTNALVSTKTFWNYPLSNTRGLGFDMVYSDNKKLRVITTYPNPFDNKVLTNKIQYKNGKGEIKELKIDSNMHNVYRFHKIIHFYYKGIVYYIFYNSHYMGSKPFIHITKIKGDSLIHVPFFDGENGDYFIKGFINNYETTYDINYVISSRLLQIQVKKPMFYGYITDRTIEFKLRNGKFIEIKE